MLKLPKTNEARELSILSGVLLTAGFYILTSLLVTFLVFISLIEISEAMFAFRLIFFVSVLAGSSFWLGGNWSQIVGLKKSPLKYLVTSVTIVLLYCPIDILLQVGYPALFAGVGFDWLSIKEAVIDYGRIDEFSRNDLIYWIIVFVLLAPVSEEVCFRGVFQQAMLRSGLNGALAISLTSAVWAFDHFGSGVLGVVSTFIFGCLLGVVREKSGSIFPPILMHGCINFMWILVWIAVWQ
jgi:membrane protease YdiL (CAAX protease family)